MSICKPLKTKEYVARVLLKWGLVLLLLGYYIYYHSFVSITLYYKECWSPLSERENKAFMERLQEPRPVNSCVCITTYYYYFPSSASILHFFLYYFFFHFSFPFLLIPFLGSRKVLHLLLKTLALNALSFYFPENTCICPPGSALLTFYFPSSFIVHFFCIDLPFSPFCPTPTPLMEPYIPCFFRRVRCESEIQLN